MFLRGASPAGVILSGLNPGLHLSNITMVNYGVGMFCCTWAQTNLRNSFDTLTRNMHFGNVRNRVVDIGPHRQIIRDLDGSLSGLDEYSEIVGDLPIRQADPLCVQPPNLGWGSIACKNTKHRRVILGNSMMGSGDVVITRRDLGVSDPPYGIPICQPPLGKWTLALAVGYEYMLHFPLNAAGERNSKINVYVPRIQESDSPYIFTHTYRKFTEERGFQQLDHAHGPDDTCDWWKAVLHDQNDKLVDCGFAGIHEITCTKTFGCCYDLSAPIPSGSGCFVKFRLNLDPMTLYPPYRPNKIVQGRKTLAGPTAIEFEASARNDVTIPASPWMSNNTNGWTLDFWMAPKEKTFYMTQNKYPEQEANLLSFHENGKPVLHVVQQKYSRQCFQCGDEVAGGEVRVTLLPMLEPTAPLVHSYVGAVCKGNDCRSTVTCNPGELPIACRNIVTHGQTIDGILWQGSAPNYECVAQGSTHAHATASIDCVKSGSEEWRRVAVDSGGYQKGQMVLATCPMGSTALSCNCYSAFMSCPHGITTFPPESARVCAMEIPNMHGSKGVILEALCEFESKDHIVRRGLVVSKKEGEDDWPKGPFTPYCLGENCPSQRELVSNGWFAGFDHAHEQSASKPGGLREEGVASQGNIVIGELMSCPQGQSGSSGIRCHGITFDVSTLVTVTKYQMSSKGDIRTGPGLYTISAWAFVSPLYDGIEQLLHTTLCAQDDCVVALGGFPKRRAKWEKCTITLNTRKNIDRFVMKLGYPLRHTRGQIHMTGVSILYDVPVTASIVTQRLPVLEWTHVLVTSQVLNAKTNARALKAYINGRPVVDSRTGAQQMLYTSPPTAPDDVGGKLGTVSSIAGRWALAPFQGSMDNVRLWNQGFVTQAQVSHAWMGNNNISGLTPVVHYDFQEMSLRSSNFDDDKDENACAIEKDIAYYGYDIKNPITHVADANKCCEFCTSSIDCALWSYNKLKKECLLKRVGAYQTRRESPIHISGTRRSPGKTVSMPCNEIWDCFECQRATDSRDQFKGQDCVPVLDHEKSCEPRAKVDGLKLVTDFKCLTFKHSLDEVTKSAEGTWKLIIRTGGGTSNSVDPYSRSYKNTGGLKRHSDGKYLLRMYSGFETHTWKQSSSPFSSGNIWGYQPVDVRGNFFGLSAANVWRYTPFALYVGLPWRETIAPTQGKIRDLSGNNYHAELRHTSNENLYLVRAGTSRTSSRKTVVTSPNGPLSCPLTVDNKNWHPLGYAPHIVDRFAVTVEPSTKVVTVERVDKKAGWVFNLQFYCTVALTDTSKTLGSDQNSIVGVASPIHAGLNQISLRHGMSYFHKGNKSAVQVGEVGGWLQMLYKHDTPSWVGPAHVCSDAGCPFVPVHEIKVYEQTFYWSDPTGWQQKKWHHGVPEEGESIVIPKEWTVILDTRTARLATLTVQGTLILANGGAHEFCRPNPYVERENQEACSAFGLKEECLMELVDEETKRVTKPADTCEWAVEPFPPLLLQAERINIQRGVVVAGNETHPYTHSLHIRMLPGRGGGVINVHGHFQLYGLPRKIWTILAAHAMVGQSRITVEGDMGWHKDDKIVITPGTTATSECRNNPPEFFTILNATVINGNTVLELDGELRQNHVGELMKASSYGEPGRPGKAITADVRAAVGLLNRNIRLTGPNKKSGVEIIVRAIEVPRPNVHQRMRAWYLEGQWGGFYRFGAKCIHRGPDTGCKTDMSIGIRYVAVTNSGKSFKQPLIKTKNFGACYYPSRDPACPIMKTYAVSKVIFIGNAVINGKGPIVALQSPSGDDRVHDNVAVSIHSVHSRVGHRGTFGVASHNLVIIVTHKIIPVIPPLTNAGMNLFQTRAKSDNNYVTNAIGPAFHVDRPLGHNVAACSGIGFQPSLSGGHTWTNEVAIGNEVGFALYWGSHQKFTNTVIVGNKLGIDFRHPWKPSVKMMDPDGRTSIALANVKRTMKGVTILGHLWPKCFVHCWGNQTDYRGDTICLECTHADVRGGKIGITAAIGKYTGVFFGRFDGFMSALIRTGHGCFPPEFSDMRLLDQDSRDAVKVMYTGFGGGPEVHKRRVNKVVGGNRGGCHKKYECDYWRQCMVKDLDGTLFLQGKDKYGRGKIVTILPANQQWDRTIEEGCIAFNIGASRQLAQACPWWVKDQPRIQRAAMFRKYQGIQRSTTENLGLPVCEAHTFTDNGLLCTDIDYLDVFVRVGGATGGNAARLVSPVGITTEGGVDGRWPVKQPRRPYATDILGSGFTPMLFRAIVPTGYFHRVDFTGNAPDNIILHAPFLRHGQSTVFRTWYSTWKEIRLRKNGKGVMMELYKDTVYPYAKHATWYYDRISRLMWVTLSSRQAVEMYALNLVRISMTAVCTVEQFYAFEGMEFLINLAQVLMINPERIKVTNVVPGNGRRRLDVTHNGTNATNTTWADPTSKIELWLIEDDVCEGVYCGSNGGFCIKTATGPLCECGDTGFTGPRCMTPIVKETVEEPPIEFNATLQELKIQQQVKALEASAAHFDYNASVNALNLTNVTNFTACTFDATGEMIDCNSNTTENTTNVTHVYQRQVETNPRNPPRVHKTGLGELADFFLRMSSSGGMDTGLKLLPDSLDMILPNISAVTDFFNGTTEIKVPYVTPVYVCGDGIHTTDEACDDGNNITGDGCSYDCEIEDDFDCFFNLIGHKTRCRDVDECANVTTKYEYSILSGFLEEVNITAEPFCQNDARCVNLPGDYVCHCTDRFEGKNCSVDVDECLINTHDCAANATCNNTYGGHMCECDPGFEGNGTVCAPIDDCAFKYEAIKSNTNPCVGPNSICHDRHLGYYCECPIGLYGDRCETNINFCKRHDKPACKHGTCKNTLTGAACACTPDSGFGGKLCDTDVNDCTRLDPCANGGKCTDDGKKPHAYSCECTKGWDGATCSEDVNDCVANACSGHGACTDLGGGTGKYECKCFSGWKGETCSQDEDECGCGKLDEPCAFDTTIVGDFGGCHRLRATCENTAGSHKCACARGSEGDGVDCRDYDECQEDPCKNGAKCVNGFARYDCECAAGWYGPTCEDNVNECNEAEFPQKQWVDFELQNVTWKPPCLQDTVELSGTPSLCSDTDEGFTCACPEHYEGTAYPGGSCMPKCVSRGSCSCEGTECKCAKGFIGDGVVCPDENECSTGNHDCHAEAMCTNRLGSFVCACNNGYAGDGKNCTDVDECSNNLHNCHADATCANIPGKFACTCKEGYSGDGTTCTDIQECLLKTHGCHPDATCINIKGNYTCVCNNGYAGTGKMCMDVNECATNAHNCHNESTCANTKGSFTCACNEGFSGDGKTCTDNDECALKTHICHRDASCANTYGNHTCACNSGYSGDGIVCVDVNECADNTDDCHKDGTCINIKGNYTCACNEGLSGDGKTCTDDDECAINTHTCRGDASCANTYGNYTCVCNRGYSGDGIVCVDVNECDINAHDCHDEGTCTNTKGNFTCACNKGFSGDGKTCTDDDECALKTHICHGNATCTNTHGTYTCTCNSGYSGDGIACVDVNECDTNAHDCHDDATCANTKGSFACFCNKGYIGDGRECIDIDECEMDTHNCHTDASCTNAKGNFKCTCNNGYSGDGVACTDIDECAAKTDNCHEKATCSNINGSFTCTCISGYSGNGIECVDVDECTAGSHQCSPDAVCANTIGSYDCACNPGFVSVSVIDGRECEDVDECVREMHNCHGDATCSNTPGSFKCVCSYGFDGDGVNCKGNFAVQYGPSLGGGVGGGIVTGLVIAVLIVILLIFLRKRAGGGQKVHDVTAIKSIESTFPTGACKPERIVLMPSMRKPKPKREPKVEPESGTESELESESENVSSGQIVSQLRLKTDSGTVLELGSRVRANGYQDGVIRYIGAVHGVSTGGTEYVGVELDEPFGSGNGSVGDRKYFVCEDFHALFTTANFLESL